MSVIDARELHKPYRLGEVEVCTSRGVPRQVLFLRRTPRPASWSGSVLVR
jgi:hypothetical protein